MINMNKTNEEVGHVAKYFFAVNNSYKSHQGYRYITNIYLINFI